MLEVRINFSDKSLGPGGMASRAVISNVPVTKVLSNHYLNPKFMAADYI